MVVRVTVLRAAWRLKGPPRVPSDRSHRRTVRGMLITGVSSPLNWDPEMRSGLNDDPIPRQGQEGERDPLVSPVALHGP